MDNNSEKEFTNFIEAQLRDIVQNNLIIYKYIGLQTGKLAIQHSTIGFTNPLSFNDPYDCSLNFIDFENIPDGYRKTLVDKYYHHLPSLEKQDMLAKMAKTPDAPVIELLKTKGMDNEIKNRGVTCFSRNFNNMLMWSHYADSHKGICIGFNLLPLYSSITNYSIEQMVVPVDYTDDFTPMNFYQHKMESIIRWLKTKAKIWSYEEEIRIIMNHLDFQDTDKFIAEIHPSSFNSVYLGANMSKENETEISEMIRSNLPDIDIYKIKPANDCFELKASPYL